MYMNKVTLASKEKSGGIKDREVVDGTDIKKLVENEELFSNFVDHKFEELDKDHDGKLSIKELQPAVADIGAALGLPSLGTSPDSDYIYSEVLNEFTHGKQEKVRKTEFKEVLTDILLGMAAGLKRDPVIIHRIDGADLLAFLNGPCFEIDMLAIYSQIDLPDGSLKGYLVKALGMLTVEQGMPPCSDSLVMSDIVQPALDSLQFNFNLDKPASKETFFIGFKEVAPILARHLKEHPVIVAHTENTFDGSGVKRLLSNKAELDEALNAALDNIPRHRRRKISTKFLRVALDVLAPSADLPPIGAVDEMDKAVNMAFKMMKVDDKKIIKEEEFKKLLVEILGSIMLLLEGNPISVSSNSVVHKPLESASSLLQAPS